MCIRDRIHSTAKAKEVNIVERSIADAIGLGLDVTETKGMVIVNFGGETTELSVIAGGGLVLNRLLKTGGTLYDESLSLIHIYSMQVYRHMDIGSAKIKKEEMDGVRHHLIDVLDPEEEFHVVRFQQMAKEAMKEIYAAGHIPIIAGGTGFYIQALLYDINFEESEQDDVLREELEQ